MALSFFLSPHLEQDCARRKLHELFVERDHIAIGVVLALLGPEACHAFMGHKLQVGGEPHAWSSRSVLVDAREFCKAYRTDALCNILELPLDRLDLTVVFEVAKMGLKVVRHEVIATAGAPRGVGNVVH